MGEQKVDALADIGSAVRTFLAAYSGWAVAHGAPATDVATFSDSTANIIVGLIAYSAIQIWSLIQKRVALKKAING